MQSDAPATVDEPQVEPSAAVLAMHRAMPMTRLVDCGMSAADASRLHTETAAGAAWTDVATSIAEERAAATTRHTLSGHPQTASQTARWAVGAALFAQMAENSDTPLKSVLYERYAGHVSRMGALRRPALERIALEHRGGHLVGWLCLPESGRAEATVVVWGGLSGWGAAYLALAEALVARGVACLLAEGPGQGEPRLRDHLYVDADVISGFARFLDAVEDDHRLGDAIGVCGHSFGGLFSAHLSARDLRVGACVVNGAPAAPTLPAFRTAREQFEAAFGTADEHRLVLALTELRFDPAEHRIGCPVLVLHGGRDALVHGEEVQLPFVRAAGPNGSLRVWPDGEHTLYNHALERDALLADWFADQLLA